MNVILDSCSLINLINGKILDIILKIPGYNFYISPLVYEESINEDHQLIAINSNLESNHLELYKNDISIFLFTSIKQKYKLGDGETECIAICSVTDFYISSDDRKARRNAIDELGNNRVIGSLFLLRQLVRDKLIGCEDVLKSYLLMKLLGGFLPKKDSTYLCN